MREIKKLIKSFDIDYKEIPEENIVQVFSFINQNHKFSDIVLFINKNKSFSKIIKSSLIKYFEHIFIKNDYLFDDFDRYVKDLMISLPLTDNQKAVLIYEFSECNKNRLK